MLAMRTSRVEKVIVQTNLSGIASSGRLMPHGDELTRGARRLKL